MMFSVRSQDSWLIEGTRSGFVHTNRWDETSGQCSQLVEDLPIGRATERDPSLVDSYSACPPLNSDLSTDSPLVADTTRGFENWSFGVDLFPGCWLEEDASISHAPSRRGTTWSFTIVGASTPRTLSARSLESASGSLLHAQPLVPLETLRWQALLDTAGRRVTLTTVNASSQSTIAAFD